MTKACDYAVVYDISSDAERARVDKTLKDFGFRIQKSVFECRLDKKGMEELIRRLERLDIKTGFVRIYRLEYSFKSKSIGEEKRPSIDGGNAFIV